MVDQTIQVDKEIQVPKTVMEEREIRIPEPVMETRTVKVPRQRIVVEEEEVNLSCFFFGIHQKNSPLNLSQHTVEVQATEEVVQTVQVPRTVTTTLQAITPTVTQPYTSTFASAAYPTTAYSTGYVRQ